jgi:hypothetical protein
MRRALGSAKSRKKQGEFRPPKSIERGQNEWDLSNLDLSPDRDFDAEKDMRKTVLERQIETVVHKWLASYKFLGQAHKLFSNRGRLDDAIHIFRRADELLAQLQPYLREDARVPSIRVEYIGNDKIVNLMATDFLRVPGEKGLLRWIVDWISEIRPQAGRPPNTVMADCAEELATVFRERTGKSRWEKTGQIVATGFAQYLPPDKGIRDYRLWIMKLVKRNRKRRQRIREFNSKSRVKLRSGSSHEN